MKAEFIFEVDAEGRPFLTPLNKAGNRKLSQVPIEDRGALFSKAKDAASAGNTQCNFGGDTFRWKS